MLVTQTLRDENCYFRAASHGARRATEEASSIAPPPDPEVAATAKRRQFSSSEKRRLLATADRCTEVGAIGALLRREGPRKGR